MTGSEPDGVAQPLKLISPPAEQRTDQANMRTGRDRARAHPGEAPHASSSRQAHQQRFGLVAGVMPGRERLQPALLRPIAEQAVALSSGAFLDRGFGDFAPAGGEDGVRHTQFLRRSSATGLRLRASLRPQRVINRRRLDKAGTGSVGEEKQRHAVGTARHRDSDAAAGREQRVEVGTEAVEEQLLDDQVASPSLRANREAIQRWIAASLRSSQ